MCVSLLCSHGSADGVCSVYEEEAERLSWAGSRGSIFGNAGKEWARVPPDLRMNKSINRVSKNIGVGAILKGASRRQLLRGFCCIWRLVAGLEIV